MLGAAERHGDDVVELQLERLAALHAGAAVALPHGAADLAGEGLAARRGRPAAAVLVLGERRASALQAPARAQPALVDEREDVARVQAVVLPEEAVHAPPVGPPAGCAQDRHGVLALLGGQGRVLGGAQAAGRHEPPGGEDVAAQRPAPAGDPAGVLGLAQHGRRR